MTPPESTVATLTSTGALATLFDPNTQAIVKVAALLLAGIIAVVHTASLHGSKAAVAQAEVEIKKIEAGIPPAA